MSLETLLLLDLATKTQPNRSSEVKPLLWIFFGIIFITYFLKWI